MKESFKLAWRSLVRGHVLSLLLASVALMHFLLPSLVRSDGTDGGWREMFIRAVPGSVYVVTAMVIIACACGFFAQERERFRLSLTVVRPVSAFAVAAGKWLALCAVASASLMLSAVLTYVRINDAPLCMHHFAPSLPSPGETARELMAEYLQDEKTPEHVKKAPKAAVLRLLTNKELERYDVVNPGKTIEWPFDRKLSALSNLVVRVRFATQFDLRAPLAGIWTFGNQSGVVSNNTQSIVDVPLSHVNITNAVGNLKFKNTGKEVVMVRPRRDLELLVPADAFACNLFRASIQMLSSIALLAAFGLFLSSALSRPVSIFTALVTVAVTLMAPSVLVQFPDELGTTTGNKIGLIVTRVVYWLSSTAGEVEPVSDLATDNCIEWKEVLRSVAVNTAVLPTILLTCSAIIIRRKPIA